VGSNPTGVMDVCRECCVMSCRGLCDGLITRPEESYRHWWVWVWSRNLVNEEALSHWGAVAPKQTMWKVLYYFFNPLAPEQET